jgi:hypothetical protein
MIQFLKHFIFKVLPDTVYDKDAFNYNNHKIGEPLTEK